MTTPGMTAPRFDDASRSVIEYLRDALPIGTWTVTRYDGERQIYLTVDDVDLGVRPGDSFAWVDTLCQHSASGRGPSVVADVRAVPEYAAIVERSGSPVTSYVSHPLRTSDNTLFGTLCGFGREPLGEGPLAIEPLIALLASLLSRIVDADLHATAVERSLEAAQREAHTDSLTGVLNRNGWERLLRSEGARFRRFGGPGAVLIVDLDDLKRVNDAQGHHAGDRLLRTAAQTLRATLHTPGAHGLPSTLDPSATIARIGGDEFAILLSGMSESVAAGTSKRLRSALVGAGASASVGLGVYHADAGLDGAWRDADAAMYRAKSVFRRTADDDSSEAMAGCP